MTESTSSSVRSLTACARTPCAAPAYGTHVSKLKLYQQISGDLLGVPGSERLHIADYSHYLPRYGVVPDGKRDLASKHGLLHPKYLAPQ